MKVTKSLLLGAAAGFVAMSGAQAADLPVKAKPVEYVKICSAYGAGFYYIPGTDICLRVGGYVFVETGVKGRNAAVDVIYQNNNFNRDDNYSQWRARGHFILDARNNTAYGTLRAYIVAGVSYATTAPAGQVPSGANTGASLDRAFIQFAGFTAGFTESFFSFGGAYSIVAGGSLPWDWLPLIAYTAQLGNGVSATLSVEDGGARRSNILGTPGTGTTSVAGALIGAYGGELSPDIVANIRVDQAWGSAQIMGALHEVRTNTVLADGGAGNKWGYAFGGGFEIKTPQTGNPNNSFLAQAQWTKGAVEYTGLASSPVTTASALGFVTGSAALGAGTFVPIADAWATETAPGAVPLSPTSLALTTAWSAYGAYRHYWTPMLRTGFAVGYTEIDNPGIANLNAIPDAKLFQGFISTIWSPVAGLDLSLDLVYSKVKTGNCVQAAGAAVGEYAVCNASNDIWTAWTRIRRNF
jgi:Porin subfamily